MNTVALGEVAEFVRGITFKPDDVVPVGEPGSVACMRTKNVQTELDLSDVYAVDARFVKRPDQYLQYGDVLISTANSWNLLGKCSWVDDLPYESSFGGFITALRPTGKDLDRRFLYHWFNYSKTQQLLRSFGRKTTNISNLPLDRCRKM
ncbi:restriction endonuclease subunit S, partial [bacterium]|nr:restriction endonuclease subunit S [bacterium]